MDHRPDCPATRPTVDFDHESLDHAARWNEIFRDLRNGCPIAWTESHGGFWIASRYDDVVRIARDTNVFSNAKWLDAEGNTQGGLNIPPIPGDPVLPNESDPPDWRKYRDLLGPLFGPSAIEKRRPIARKFVAAVIDRVIESGRLDLVTDLTNPLPALVTMDLMGLPIQEWPEWAEPCHVIAFAPKESPEFARSMDSMGWMRARLYEEFALRREQPKDDLIGYLVTARIDGEPLDDRTLFSLCFNIIIGGVDTTTALTANALMYLDEHPEARRRLIADRGLLPTACEEFLRYYSPLHGLARNVKADVTVNRQKLSAGERILLAYASANHDETIFDSPEEIILDRLPNKHIGFGIGIHRCLGSFLARMMFQVMVEEVLDRLPDYKIDRDRAEHYPSICTVNGWARLPASFTPGARVGDNTLSPS